MRLPPRVVVTAQHQRLALVGRLLQPAHQQMTLAACQPQAAQHVRALRQRHRRGERVARIRGARCPQLWCALRFRVPRDPDRRAIGDHHGPVHRASRDPPAVRMHVARGRPAFAIEADDARVADLVGAASPVDDHDAAIRHGGRGGAAVAGGRVQRPLGVLLRLRAVDRGTQHHRRATAVMAVIVMRMRTLDGLLPTVQPGDAQPVARLRPERHEAVIARRAGGMHQLRRAPRRSSIAGMHQVDAVVHARGPRAAQPVRPQRTVRQGMDVRCVGPVDEPFGAFGDRARHLPVPGLRRATAPSQPMPAFVHRLHPAQQQRTIRRSDQVRLRGTGRRRQAQVFHLGLGGADGGGRRVGGRTGRQRDDQHRQHEAGPA